MRKFVPGLVGLVAMCTLIAGIPAAQAATSAYPVRPFRIAVGNTYTTGTVTFYNRVVRVAGEHKAVSGSGCRLTWAATYADGVSGQLDENQSSVICQGSRKFSFDVPANVSGGASKTHVVSTRTTAKSGTSSTGNPCSSDRHAWNAAAAAEGRGRNAAASSIRLVL